MRARAAELASVCFIPQILFNLILSNLVGLAVGVLRSIY